MEQIKRIGLTANQIKWIAIVCMLIDHIAWGFVPFGSAAGQVMHIFGRITAPTMCFFIAEGYAHTHNVKRYALRLGLFALISQFPFTLFETGKIQYIVNSGTETFSVIYTLFLSLLAVWAWDSIQNRSMRIFVIGLLCILSLPGDWMCFDILFSLVFWIYRGDFAKQARYFSTYAVCMVVLSCLSSAMNGYSFIGQLFQFGVLLCLPILSMYNGKRRGSKNSKWTFYIFYPVHLLILGLVKFYL